MPVSCCTIALKLEVSAERTAMGAFLLMRGRRLLTLVAPAPADAGEDKAMEAVAASAELIHEEEFSCLGFKIEFPS